MKEGFSVDPVRCKIRSDFIKQSVSAQSGFRSDSGWVILNEIEASIKAKIEALGVPLNRWDIQINYGIKTGFNEAFIIDGNKRHELLKKCPEADTIIRPIVLGRNIKRYQYHWEGLWLINSHNGVKGEFQRIDIEKDYPVIYAHLRQFLPQVELRSDQGDHWTNLRNCAYLEDFDKPKIAWGNLALKGQFAFIKEPMMINAPSPFFATDNIYILALLNTTIADFYIKQLGVTRSGGYFEYKPMFVEQFPIPQVSKTVQDCFIEKVERLLSAPNDMKLQIENELDEMAFDLYNFTPEERGAIYRGALSTNSISSGDSENIS